MDSRQSKIAVKLLPSMTDFAFLLPIVFLFGRMEGVKTLLSDCDTGWHIRTGEWIVANHQVPARDFFSFTKTGEPWYAWEWLADVLFAWLNSHGGLATVVLASILLLAITFTLLFRLARRKANPIIAFLVTLIAAATSSIHWLARPHLFSLLFLVLFYGALERVRGGNTRFHGVPYLVLLPVATILWTNLHGGFFIGIIMIGAYGVGELLKLAFAADRSRFQQEPTKARNYLFSAAACLAASLVNPYFYHLHQHVFEYLGDPYQAQHIVEFLSVSFHHPVAIFFEGLLLAGMGAAFWNLSKGSYTEGVLLLLWAHAALLASRNLPLYAIVATPVVAAAVDAWLKRLPELEVAGWLKNAARRFLATAAETAETDALPRWHLASAVGILVVAALLYAPAPPRGFRSEYDPKSYPAGAVALLRADSSARIFTNDEWGDYLIYRLYPRTLVFVDGRSDFYGDSFEQKYLDVMNVKYDWENTLGRFGIDTILLPPSAALAGALKESSRWSVVYDDGIALVFRSKSKTAGNSISSTLPGDGTGRDREITKTQARDQAITEIKTKTKT
jgi:hypothetical protein